MGSDVGRVCRSRVLLDGKMLDFVVHYGDDSPDNNFIVYRYWSANIGLRTDYIHRRLTQLGRWYSSYTLPFGKAS